MKPFIEYVDQKDLEWIIKDCADIVIKQNLNIDAINELTEILEGIGSTLGGVAGGLTGAALTGGMGAIPSAMAGARAGQQIDKGVSNWMQKGRAYQVTPIYQKAVQSINDLIAAATHSNNPDLLKTANQLQTSLKSMEPNVGSADQSAVTQHNTQAQQAGGIAQNLQQYGANNKDQAGFKGWLGKGADWLGGQAGKVDALNQQGGVRGAMGAMGDKFKSWSAKNPRLSKAMKTGGLIGTGLAAGSMLGGGDGGGGEVDPNTVDPGAANAPVDPNTGAVNAPPEVDPNTGAVNAPPEVDPNTGAPNADGQDWVDRSAASTDSEGLKNMSPEDWEQYDQHRRQTAVNMGNPDPGPLNQADAVSNAERHQHTQKMRDMSPEGRAYRRQYHRDKLNR